jgi:hypothetical protein
LVRPALRGEFRRLVVDSLEFVTRGLMPPLFRFDLFNSMLGRPVSVSEALGMLLQRTVDVNGVNM